MEETENGSAPRSCAANVVPRATTVNKVLNPGNIDFAVRFVARKGEKYLFRHLDNPANVFARDAEYFREYCKMAAERFIASHKMVIEAEECNAALMLNALADKVKPGFNPREYVIAAGMANVAR